MAVYPTASIMPLHSLSRRWHVFAILLLCGSIILIYAPAAAANYCGFDDFLELHRASFQDSQDPSLIWTTTHRGSGKYRPLYRLANDVTFWWGHGSPRAFHLRNLFFHCLAAIAVYLLGLLFFSWPVAMAAALLFGLHPLTHQAVAVAGFFNAAPNAQFLYVLVFFLIGYRSTHPLTRWGAISLGLLSGTLALFTYEPSLVAFGLIYCYLAIEWLFARKPPAWRFLIALTFGVCLAAGSYFAARSLLLPQIFAPTALTPPGIVFRNLTIYVIGLLLPVDSILAHDWLGTPFPNQIKFTTTLWVLLTAVVAIIVTILAKYRTQIGARLKDLPFTPMVFLGLAMVCSLSLFLLFTDHASETYVAVPTAFFSLALCATIWQWFSDQPLHYSFAVGVLILLAALASLNRSGRVASCGETVTRIVGDLPAPLRRGPATIWMSNFPGEEASEVFGIYGYKGLDTIGPNSATVEAALQLVCHNEQLRVRRVSPMELVTRAREPVSGDYYLFVHSDGTLSKPGRLLF